MLKRNGFFRFFLSKGFGEKCKHTEVALNFVQKQNFSLKKHISSSFESNRNTVNQEKVAFKIFNFWGYSETLKKVFWKYAGNLQENTHAEVNRQFIGCFCSRQFCYSETSLTKLLIWKRNLKNSLCFCKHFVIWDILLMIYLSHLVNFSLEALIIFILFNCQLLKFTFKAVCYINNAWMLL